MASHYSSNASHPSLYIVYILVEPKQSVFNKTTGTTRTEAWVKTAVMLNTSCVDLICLATWDLSFYWKRRSYNSRDLAWEPSDLECVKCKLVLMKRITSKMTTFNYVVPKVIIQTLIMLAFVVVVVAVTIIIRMKMFLPQFLKVWRKQSSPTRRPHSEIRIYCLEGLCRNLIVGQWMLGSRVQNPWLVF